MRALVLRVDKEKKKLLLFDGKRKFYFTLPQHDLKKVVEWDSIEIVNNEIKVIKRAKPISVEKLLKLKNYLKGPIYISIHGFLEKDTLKWNGFSVDIVNPPIRKEFQNKHILLENVLLNKGKIQIVRNSRIFAPIS